MSAMDDRRNELVAAAASGDLTDAETRELRALAAADPTVDAEIEELRDLLGRLEQHQPTLPWIESVPSEQLKNRILDATESNGHEAEPEAGHEAGHMRADRKPRRSPRLLAAAGVLGIAVGAGVVLGLDAFDSRPVTGPPGTLGAYEEIAFTAVASGTEVEGGFVAHTWGTETVLEMDGIPDRGRYEVYLVERSGTELASGTFLGSQVTIDCRMNAAVMREDVSGIEIRNSDGSILARAMVPPSG